jgi:hypothetical protein
VDKEKILYTINKIKASTLSVREYFKTNTVPFSQAQFYNYCKILKKYGEERLYDKRQDGNSTKLIQPIKDYIKFTVKEDKSISSSQVAEKIQKEFKTKISRQSINNYRKSVGLIRESPSKENQYQRQESGGGEIITSLALYTNLIDLFTQTIQKCVNEVTQLPSFEEAKGFKKDYPEYRCKGKFTLHYNKLKSVRENRFKSIDEKIPKKNLSSMKVFQMSERTMSRYNLALLCLPLVTSNGKTSRVNRVKGNDLEFLCGYNYRDAALDKYLRELKYLKVSETLIIETAKFWMNFWKDKSKEETYFVCYYIDGNTKALWSSGRHYKGKVTMLGRVMNCLENVFIHDGKGHPLYFQTFQGNTDLGKNALRMLRSLITHFADDSVDVKQILVMDGGGNSVKTMRAFKDSEENFITILDKNQVKDRKFKQLNEKERYKYGDAHLVDSKIELKDSSEKEYICELRAVIVNWDNGRQSVLVTDISSDLLDASEIVKRYFDRWPMQEKRFRDEKAGVNIHRIVGYGRKIEEYTKMKEKHEILCKKIRKLKADLERPLKEIKELEKECENMYRQERRLREKSKIECGTRILNEKDARELKKCESEIERIIRKQNKIKKEYSNDFRKLTECIKEEERIRVKDKVYRIDTELDQIMTCFKLSFVNLCSYLLKECMDNEKYELLKLFESIFQLNGKAIITEKEKRISLKENKKEPKLKEKIFKLLQKLNTMEISNLEGKRIVFNLCSNLG